jgi:hypothetical protein
MKGREVFRFATRVMARATREVAKEAEVPVEDIELLVPHQANARIIESAARSLKLDSDGVYSNLQRYGNTSAASVPIALCEAIEEERIHPGDHLVLVGFGGGLTWGASLIQWEASIPLTPLPRLKRILLSLRYRWARVESFFRRTWRWLDGLTKPSNGDNLLPWSGTKDRAKTADDDIRETREGTDRASKQADETNSSGIDKAEQETNKTGNAEEKTGGQTPGRKGH